MKYVAYRFSPAILGDLLGLQDDKAEEVYIRFALGYFDGDKEITEEEFRARGGESRPKGVGTVLSPYNLREESSTIPLTANELEERLKGRPYTTLDCEGMVRVRPCGCSEYFKLGHTSSTMQTTSCIGCGWESRRRDPEPFHHWDELCSTHQEEWDHDPRNPEAEEYVPSDGKGWA